MESDDGEWRMYDGDEDPNIIFAAVAADGSDGATNCIISIEEADNIRKRVKKADRDRLVANISEIIRIINKPLRDIILDHALPYLPPRTLLRFRSVSNFWNRHLSSPLFAHTQSRTHHSISGLFSQSSPFLPPYFFPFDRKSYSIPDPSLSFLPHSPITVRSSSNGLLCCLSESNYLICNPSTMEWTTLPEPSLFHGLEPNVVPVFEPSVYNFNSDYFLVCAFEIEAGTGVYGFEIYTSASGEWRTSNEICSAEGMIAGSGVSAGGVAYWRTSMQTVVGYNPTADSVRVMTWPVEYAVGWQLGEINGRLCCVSVTESDVVVHVLGSSDWWTLLGTFLVAESEGWKWVKKEGNAVEGGIIFRGMPWPLRFQSGKLEVVMWVDGSVFVLDLAGRRVRDVCFGVPAPTLDAVHVSHINTLAPVFPQVASTSET